MTPCPAVSKSRAQQFCRTIAARESNQDYRHWRVLAVFSMDIATSVESCWNFCKEVPPVSVPIKPVVSPKYYYLPPLFLALGLYYSILSIILLRYISSGGYILVKERRYYSRPDLCRAWDTLGSKFLTKKVARINKLYLHVWSRHHDWVQGGQQNGFAKGEQDFHLPYNWNMA